MLGVGDSLSSAHVTKHPLCLEGLRQFDAGHLVRAMTLHDVCLCVLAVNHTPTLELCISTKSHDAERWAPYLDSWQRVRRMQVAEL